MSSLSNYTDQENGMVRGNEDVTGGKIIQCSDDEDMLRYYVLDDEEEIRLPSLPSYNEMTIPDASANEGLSQAPSASSTDSREARGGDEINNFTGYGDFDVLCGRGGLSNNHVGNKEYLKLIKETQPNYQAASKKKEKTIIASGIVSTIQEKGRFLAEDDHGQWYEITDERARTKVSACLRQNHSKKKRTEEP